MGMGEIIGGGPCGRYQVRLIHNKQRIEDARAILVDRRTQMELDVARAQDLWDGAWQELQDARAELESLMQTLPAENSSVKQARNRVFFAEAAVQRAESALHQARARLKEATKRLAELALEEDPVIDAFCADYTKTLNGIVGTCEVNGEGAQEVVIRPGFTDDAEYDADRDGLLFHRNSLSAEQAYFNAAIFPGWQKWKPTYRVGVVLESTVEEPPRLNVDFRPIDPRSSAQGLPINQRSVITAAVDYMACRADYVFKPGDRVLVEFREQNWGEPVVIGFADGPRPCEGEGEVYAFFHPSTGARISTDYLQGGDFPRWRIALRQFGASWPFPLMQFDPATNVPVENTEIYLEYGTDIVALNNYYYINLPIPPWPADTEGTTYIGGWCAVNGGTSSFILGNHEPFMTNPTGTVSGIRRVLEENGSVDYPFSRDTRFSDGVFELGGASFRIYAARNSQSWLEPRMADLILRRVSIVPEDGENCPQFS